MVGAKYDTMDPKAMEEQSKLVQNGSYLYCPNGSHLAMWDDQKVFMSGVIQFMLITATNKLFFDVMLVIVGQLSRKNKQEIETKILKLIFIVFDLLFG
jgi:hypothetical protein